MTYEDDLKQQAVAEFQAQQRRDMRDRMAALGRSRSAKKRKASIANARKATKARMRKRLKGKK